MGFARKTDFNRAARASAIWASVVLVHVVIFWLLSANPWLARKAVREISRLPVVTVQLLTLPMSLSPVREQHSTAGAAKAVRKSTVEMPMPVTVGERVAKEPLIDSSPLHPSSEMSADREPNGPAATLNLTLPKRYATDDPAKRLPP
jgi:hypothetical protein